MIRRIRIQNFASLVDVDTTLGPLTLLVGPNASGKTMFIRALRTLTKLMRSTLRTKEGDFSIDFATMSQLVTGSDPSKEIRLAIWIDDTEGPPTYEVALARENEKWFIADERIHFQSFHFEGSQQKLEFKTERRGTVVWETPGDPPRSSTLPYLAYAYRADSSAMQSLQPLLDLQRAVGVSRVFRISSANLMRPGLPNWIRPERPYVDDTGSGFIHTLSRFSQTSRGRGVLGDKIIPGLRELFPHITNLGFQGSPSWLQLEYESDRYRGPLPAQLESDGVNLALFLICLPFLLSEPGNEDHPTPVCVGLEEPEAGTHPFFQRNRLQILRHLSRGHVSAIPLQIIATTHSLDFLRWVEREEAMDVLRFAEHLGPDLGTRIQRLTHQEDLDRVYEMYDHNPGLAWYSGVFGAVPPIPDLAPVEEEG